MRIDDVIKLVLETKREKLRNHMMWYNTKCDQNILMALQRARDMEKLMKGNDEFGYMYIIDKEGPIRQLMQVSRVDGDLEWAGCAGVRVRGYTTYTHESGVASQSGRGYNCVSDSG